MEAARAQIAGLIGCKPVELVFTSGATEADNLALNGVAYAYRERGTHLITSQIEHHAVLDSCKRDRKSTRLNSSHSRASRMPSSA